MSEVNVSIQDKITNRVGAWSLELGHVVQIERASWNFFFLKRAIGYQICKSIKRC